MPELERLNKELQSQKVKIILVSLDFINKIETGLLPYLQKNNIQSKVILLNDPDANSWIDKVDPSWSGSIPATLIYKSDSKHFIEKSVTFEEIVEIINHKI